MKYVIVREVTERLEVEAPSAQEAYDQSEETPIAEWTRDRHEATIYENGLETDDEWNE